MPPVVPPAPPYQYQEFPRTIYYKNGMTREVSSEEELKKAPIPWGVNPAGPFDMKRE